MRRSTARSSAPATCCSARSRWPSSPACSWPAHGGADPGAARRRGAHRRGRSRPAHRHQDRRRGRGARRSVQRHGGPAPGILCRPGEEGRGPHARTDRGAGAADGDVGGFAGNAARRGDLEPVFEAILGNDAYLRSQIRQCIFTKRTAIAPRRAKAICRRAPNRCGEGATFRRGRRASSVASYPPAAHPRPRRR